MKYFDEIEKSARERNIPVMQKEGIGIYNANIQMNINVIAV